MANTFTAGTAWNPYFYANEALIQLEKSLGMAGRVYRGYDKTPQQKGSTIQIRQPQSFTAAAAPASATSLAPPYTSVVLDQWYEVKFEITDKELSYTPDSIIDDHIRPAAVALADNIDQALCALFKEIPYYVTQTSSAAVADILNCRKVLFNNGSPMEDLHLMVNGTTEAELLALAAFSQFQGVGPSVSETLLRGSLGTKFGFEVFANQNVPSFTGGVATDCTGAVNNAGGYAIGSTSIAVNGFEASGTVKAGDIFTLTGDPTQYNIAADATFTTGAATLTISPGLEKAATNTQVCNIVVGTRSGVNLAFQRNAFALAMAPLSDLGNELGAKVANVTDPKTGLSLRSRIFYDGGNSKVIVALDVLYGVKTLNRKLCIRLEDA